MGHTNSRTPLEVIVGVDIAGETYDSLNLYEQIIVDLTILGWKQTHIAEVLSMSQPAISAAMRRISIKLADSRLKQLLEARQHYRETNSTNVSAF